MEFNESLTNTSLSLPITIAVDITHLIVVIIPSLLLSSLLLYCLHVKKVFVSKPLSFLYGCVAIVCILAPTSYGVGCFAYALTPQYFTSDDECATLTLMIDFAYGGGQIVLCFSIGMIVIVQFVTASGKWKRAVTVKNVAVAYILLLVTVLCANVIFFATICRQERKDPSNASTLRTSSAVWGLVSFLIPLLSTIIFPVLTYLKVKQNVLAEKVKILNTLVLVSTFNILSYVFFRLLGLLLYTVSITIYSDDRSAEWNLNIVALTIGNFTYPITIFFTFVVNSKIRRIVCCSTEANSTSTVPASASGIATSELPSPVCMIVPARFH